MLLKPLLLLLAVPAVIALGAEPAPEPLKLAPLPAAPEQPLPALPSLLPDQIVPRAAPARKSEPPVSKKPGSTMRPPATALDLELRIRYRKARNVAESDATVRAAWDRSRAATTDYAKRQALKSYYEALFGKMLAIDKGIAPLVDGRKRDHAVALEQLQIAPTVPLP